MRHTAETPARASREATGSANNTGGAGSIGFTRKQVHDILCIPELRDTEFAFTDINERNLDMVYRLCKRDVESAGLPAKISATLDRREAFRDANYVFSFVRVGGLEGFTTDIDIPLKYGVDQCVGDTLCAGGIMYAQRGIPALLDFCKDIREVAQRDAVFLNYSNPMAMNTWACNKYGGVQTIGLCHGVQGAHWQITDCVNRWAKAQGLVPQDYEMHRREVDVIAAGLNHQTWFIKVNWRGIDMVPKMLEMFESHPEYSRTEKVRIDVLRRIASDLDRRQLARGKDDRALQARRVEEITEDLPHLPDFSEFDIAFRPVDACSFGDMRSAFYAGYEESDREHVLIGMAGRRLAEGRTLVSTTFVVPYPPGFPVLVPGQVVSKEIVYFLAQLDVKEIHGYTPDLGLSVFTEAALARMEAQRNAATAALGSALPVFALPADARGNGNGDGVVRTVTDEA